MLPTKKPRLQNDDSNDVVYDNAWEHFRHKYEYLLEYYKTVKLIDLTDDNVKLIKESFEAGLYAAMEVARASAKQHEDLLCGLEDALGEDEAYYEKHTLDGVISSEKDTAE